MRRFLGIATVGLLILSGCASTSGFQTSTKKEEIKDDLTSLRKHLKYRYWKFLPVSDTETIVVYTDGGWGVPYAIRFASALNEYCTYQGGKLVSGNGLDKVSFSDFLDEKGHYNALTARNEMLKYFGPGITYKCEGGHDSFEVSSVKGNHQFYRSTGDSKYFVSAYIKASKPDAFIDNGFFNKKSLEKYKNLDLKGFIKSECGFFGDLKFGNWRGNKYFAETTLKNPNPTYVYEPESWTKGMGIIWKSVEFCKAHGGELRKITSGKDLPLDMWIKDYFLKDRGYNYIYSSGSYYSPVEGLYYCANSEVPFMEQLKFQGVSKTGGKFKIIIKEGIDKSLIPASASQGEFSHTKPQSKSTSAGKNVMQSLTASIEDIIAIKTSKRGDLIKKVGSIVYRGTFNGKERNCEYVSVLTYTQGLPGDTIINYKICNGQIVEKEPTGVESVPSDVKALIPKVAKLAQLHGRAEMEGNGGYRIIANAVRDEKQCAVEVKILKGIKLVRDEIVNACKL
ncbi:hypothetical protein [Desulfurobacterium crinifex]